MRAQLTTVAFSAAVDGLLIYVALYTRLMWPHPLTAAAHAHAASRESFILLACLTAIALTLSLVFGVAFLWLMVGVSAATGVVLSTRNAFIATLMLTLLTLGLGVLLAGGLAQTDWLHLLPLVLLVRGLGLDMTGIMRLSGVLRDLQAARLDLARQAVTDERLRLARDLHDLLGRTLSLIALKSELAGRVLDKEPERALQEIGDVETAARTALHEVREAVACSRPPALPNELDAARQMLNAAGIACRVEYAGNSVPALASTALAWAVREGVTNVIRHSRARCCSIQVKALPDKVCVEIINDLDSDHARRDEGCADAPSGSGLLGLDERMVALGGRIEAGAYCSDGQPAFRLWAEVPVQRGKPSATESQP